MILKVLSEGDRAKYEGRLLEMMRESDTEFVPPLSARASTTQKRLTAVRATGDVSAYFKGMLGQEILAAFDGGELICYVSYKLDYTNGVITEKDLPNIYLSTLISDKKARGKGVTAKLYSYLFNTLYPDRSVYTRTWSTNAAHIHILLDKFGFTQKARLEDDRGKGIDTVYFELKR